MDFYRGAKAGLIDPAKACMIAAIQQALAPLERAQVVAATVNHSGVYEVPPPLITLPIPLPTLRITDLPPFCDVLVHWHGEGGHIAHIKVWVPIDWNGRLMATLGAGNRTEIPAAMPQFLRVMTLSGALRRRFAAASTDGGNRDPRSGDWGLIEGTDAVDWRLTENWVHRSTHEMALVAKTVVKALHGVEPKFSYAVGSSGGGRQAIVAAQRYPGDFDGIWASDPAIHWTKAIPAGLWPALVMKEFGALGPGKLEAFRQAAVSACDGLDGLTDGVIGAFDPCEYSPHLLVGTETSEGPITTADAEVMLRIWQGPRTPEGRFLWYGLRPGAESWGENALARGLCMTQMSGSARVPVPFYLAVDYLKAWVVRDASWDWTTLNIEGFARLFAHSVELRDLASDDPDLSQFVQRGGKLILSHGADDQVLPAAGTVTYYAGVVEKIGSLDETRQSIRLFVAEGDGHSAPTERGPGLNTDDVLDALIRWVETETAPDLLVARTVEPRTGTCTATKPVYAYPYVPRYAGGPPNAADSFEPIVLQRVSQPFSHDLL